METSLEEGPANHTENEDNSSTIEKQSRCAWLQPFLSPLLQSFFIQFMTGVNEGNLGIILPHIKDHHSVDQTVISTVLLCYASGFAIGIDPSKNSDDRSTSPGDRIRHGVYSVAFPALCLFYVFIGFGVALTQSGANMFVGELPKATMMLKFLHAFFGLGALLGPFIASALLQHRPWNYTYLVLASLAVVSLITCIFSFRKTMLSTSSLLFSNSIRSNHYSASGTTAVSSYIEENNNSQVTIGDWAYTFLITERSDNQLAMTHLLSGYW
ncbi:hypothetical protein BDC45DRAFT_539061 [Circinella umbellata]|nr:hypothetical protein BDC45DRAFT_539061 [Circinella umbellata]